MYSNMKQIAIEIGHARPIFARSTEFLYFQNELGPCPREEFIVLTL